MAKLNLQSIGSPLKQKITDNNVIEREVLLDKKRQEIKEGLGKVYRDRVLAKEKLVAHDRVIKLADDASQILFINTFVNYGLHFGDEKKVCPNAGVITAFVKIHNRWAMVIANDNTVASGSWWPKTPEKIVRAQEIALKLKIPVIYLVDCSGLFLPQQANTFPGHSGAGRIFYMNSLLNHHGVPQIAGVLGDCIAGGGYMPIISDRVLMTEQAYMVIAGAALIRGAKSLHLSSHDIGGPHVHVHISNCADERVPDDETLLIKVRDYIKLLPSSAIDFFRGGFAPLEPNFSSQELPYIIPASYKETFAIKEVLARLVDQSLFYEFEPGYGQEVICGIGRVSGLYVGFLANNVELSHHPHEKGLVRGGGILYREGVKKLSRFSRCLNEDGIPLCWLQDVSGFDVGVEAEKQGLLAYGSSLIYANSTNSSPMMTILLRRASGAGYYAMAGMPYDPVLQLGTTISRLAVMEGSTLAIGAFNSKLDDNFCIIAKNDDERREIEKGMRQVSERIEKDMDPYTRAANMDIDEIIKFKEIKQYLSCFVECSYQSTNHRRIKNPRIWSIHDQEKESPLCVIKDQPIETIKSINDQAKTNTQEDKSDESVIFAPIDGLLYLSSSSEHPPFVNKGSSIIHGQTLALIEVMKSYYPLKYEGKKKAIIEKVVKENASSVKSGEVIFTLKIC
jgi:3-methylcrotonyl-CoA carboxylase beta subunit